MFVLRTMLGLKRSDMPSPKRVGEHYRQVTSTILASDLKADLNSLWAWYVIRAPIWHWCRRLWHGADIHNELILKVFTDDGELGPAGQIVRRRDERESHGGDPRLVEVLVRTRKDGI
jgi:hypothetical protein